ncbi:RNR2B [Scenedesmus sp. PABB004]|nr:RNR2B [Scenedesmus sp. PABB004]
MASLSYVRELGRGSFGRVVLARDDESGALVAVKKLPRAALHRESTYVHRELLLHASLRHPHIVRFHQVFLSPTNVNICMEWVPDGTLLAYVQRCGRLGEARARWLFQQLMLAVDYCHRKGVANRCGVVLYVMLVGRTPFAAPAGPDSNLGRTALEMLTAMSARDFPLPPWLSAGARELLASLLDPRPRRRAGVADVLAHPWFAADLPAAARDMNASYLALPRACAQSDDELRAVLARAAPEPEPAPLRSGRDARAAPVAVGIINQTSQAVFGGAPGASDAAVARADSLARAANVVLSASWLVFLFFVPAGLQWLRGARNAFSVMMFAWAGAGAALVGAFALSATADATPSAGAGMLACSLVFGLLVGVFGGLGYTATEVYLDTCAELMPLALEVAGQLGDGTPHDGDADGGDGGGPPKGGGAAAGAPPPAAPLLPERGASLELEAPHGARAGAGAGLVGEAAAARALTHKFIASKYKNTFASHIYAFVEVGTVAFTLPGALGVDDGRRLLYLLVSITACLFAGALASLFVPDLQDPAHAADHAGGAGGARRGACAALGAAACGAGRSAVQSITCLSAYNWLAALAIVPYFLSAAYADNYFQFVVLGTQCGLREAPLGIGLSGVNVLALVGSAVQAAAAFAGPALVGPRRFQFAEHVMPLAIGNACGVAAALVVVGLGGLTPRICGSLGVMLGVKTLSAIAYGVNNSVGVAAVLCWYSGRYQTLVVAALASRSVWTQLGGIIGPFTFGDAFATLRGGAPAAGLAAGIYAAGSVCVVAADRINVALERRRAGARAAALGPTASVAELELAGQEGRMTAGFLDAPAARRASSMRRRPAAAAAADDRARAADQAGSGGGGGASSSASARSSSAPPSAGSAASSEAGEPAGDGAGGAAGMGAGAAAAAAAAAHALRGAAGVAGSASSSSSSLCGAAVALTLDDDGAGAAPGSGPAASRRSLADEPLLAASPNHYTLAVSYAPMWTMYKQALASFWTVDEVDLSHDLRDWRKLTANEQHFIKYVLAFFAGSDGIVLENLALRFMQDVAVPEVRAFYGFQIAMENIHAEMYTLLLESYVADAAERAALLDAINRVPVIARKAEWAIKWIGSSASFAQRLLAFACVEGIHFSGSFCAIFWLKKRGLMPGLTFSNELISRDEGLHTDFAVLLYRHLHARLPEPAAHALVGEAVELEREFICEALRVRRPRRRPRPAARRAPRARALPSRARDRTAAAPPPPRRRRQCEVVGMNAGLMERYIQYVADRLLVDLGYAKLYGAANPFDWMEMISLQGKSNFFERRVGEYQKAGVMAGAAGKPGFEQFVFTTTEDF